MSVMRSAVRLARHATDAFAPFSFNRLGFAWNRLGFEREAEVEGRGRVILVTGASSGIGLATSRELVARGFEVWMLCRDRERGMDAKRAILRLHADARIRVAVVDISSLASIRRFVRELGDRKIDGLIHNAGVLPHVKHLTDDGVELTFATHVLGPFVLTALLAEKLSASDDARVVFVASGGLYLQRLDLGLLDVPFSKFDGTRAYANAKRAQVILGHVLAERFASSSITFASMHPGWADTRALETSLPRFHGVMRPFLRTPEQAADTVVWLATSARPKGTRGLFWFDRRVAREHVMPFTREDASARAELVRRCEVLSGVELEVAREEAA